MKHKLGLLSDPFKYCNAAKEEKEKAVARNKHEKLTSMEPRRHRFSQVLPSGCLNRKHARALNFENV